MPFVSSFRRWWRPPRSTVERAHERRITYLELFYDLVFVVLVSEVTHQLALHLDLDGVLRSSFLFVLVWFGWANGTLYHELHGHDDIRTRVLTFLQMFAVAALAVYAHGAWGEAGPAFSAALAVYQGLLTWMWWRTGAEDPLHRPLSIPYVVTFLGSTLLFAAAVVVPPGARAALWGAALVGGIGVVAVMYRYDPTDPEIRAEHERSVRVTASVVERFDLFTIIVLGEVIVGVIRGVAAREHLDGVTGATAALGMLVSFALWWLYFDLVSRRLPRPGRGASFAWLVLHPVIALGIAASGPAVLTLVEQSGEPLTASARGVLVGAVALAMVGIGLKMATLKLPEVLVRPYAVATAITLAAAVAVVGLGVAGVSALPLLAGVDALLLLPIAYAAKVWIVRFDAGEIPFE